MFSNNTEELAQNKLILLYIIKNSPDSFDKNELLEYILEKDYLNFFLTNQYLSELLEGEFIELLKEEGKKKYMILEKGILALQYFDSKIPSKIKEGLKQDSKSFSYTQEKDTQILADYFLKQNKEYMVNLKLVENEETLFSVYISVPSSDAAKTICEKWKQDTQKVYTSIMDALI